MVSTYGVNHALRATVLKGKSMSAMTTDHTKQVCEGNSKSWFGINATPLEFLERGEVFLVSRGMRPRTDTFLASADGK